LSIGSDITDRKRAEEQVQRLHDDLRLHADTLEEQVAVRTAELAAINDKIAGLVSPLAEKKNIELQISLSDIPVMITTDQRRLEQVILNLMNNAIKFTEIGHVGVTLRSEKKYFLLSFTDTGIGIQHQDLANLFQPFRQIDSGLARKREGTGLGLSICKKIVDLMGGSIEVQSQWGKGSIFIVRIPHQQEKGAA
jgi:signal transduction histidine kinase